MEDGSRHMNQIFDDLKPRRLAGINLSTATAYVNDDNNKIIELEIWTGPGGGLMLRRPEPVPIDQIGEREKKSTAERWATAGIDQREVT